MCAERPKRITINGATQLNPEHVAGVRIDAIFNFSNLKRSEVVNVDEKSAKYFQRDVNATIMPAMFGREKIGLDREHITITDPETNNVLYNFFNKYHPPRPPKTEDKSEEENPKTKPKHSGNKLAYAKLYISEIHKYPKEKLSYEYAGMCMHLAPYIEWDDGYLAIGNGKRRRFMERKDIAKALKVSDSTTRRFISKLEELKLMSYDGSKYKMVGKLFGKGREIECESSLKKE